jgi:hypothetical protein
MAKKQDRVTIVEPGEEEPVPPLKMTEEQAWKLGVLILVRCREHATRGTSDGAAGKE